VLEVAKMAREPQLRESTTQRRRIVGFKRLRREAV
jgi:hypothetical protein